MAAILLLALIARGAAPSRHACIALRLSSPQHAPAFRADPSFHQLAGTGCGKEMQAGAALLLALWPLLVFRLRLGDAAGLSRQDRWHGQCAARAESNSENYSTFRI